MTQYVQAKIATIERPVTAWAFLAVAFLLVCAYAYFVNGAIASIVSAKDMQSVIADKSSSVGGLERELLALKSDLHLDYALALGFQKSEDTVYVSKKSTTALSLNK